jgi:hypothetical protein
MARISLVVAMALGLFLIAGTARSEDRLFDGALGVGAGAVVLGPVGAVAGGVIGYAAGPSISCSLRGGCWKHRHHHRPHAAAASRN